MDFAFLEYGAEMWIYYLGNNSFLFVAFVFYVSNICQATWYKL